MLENNEKNALKHYSVCVLFQNIINIKSPNHALKLLILLTNTRL